MGWSVSIPKTWYLLTKVDQYDLTNSYFKHYYCRSKKRIYRVNEKEGTRTEIEPRLYDGEYRYVIRPYFNQFLSFDRETLIDSLKTQLKGESDFVDLDDLENPWPGRRHVPDDPWSEESAKRKMGTYRHTLFDGNSSPTISGKEFIADVDFDEFEDVDLEKYIE